MKEDSVRRDIVRRDFALGEPLFVCRIKRGDEVTSSLENLSVATDCVLAVDETASIMMKIAVVCATGPTGLRLVTGLRKTVATVRAVARSRISSCGYFPRRPLKSGKPIFATPTRNPVGGRGRRRRLRRIGLQHNGVFHRPV
jgi:hypothetical protein